MTLISPKSVWTTKNITYVKNITKIRNVATKFIFSISLKKKYFLVSNYFWIFIIFLKVLALKKRWYFCICSFRTVNDTRGQNARTHWSRTKKKGIFFCSVFFYLISYFCSIYKVNFTSLFFYSVLNSSIYFCYKIS